MRIKLSLEFGIIFTLFVTLSIIGLSVNTTGDAGDSILHYLYSKYAINHPELFLNHWAKPVFVLLSSPFSQFGFKGIIIFNCLVVTLTCFYTYRTAINLKIKNAWLLYLLFLFSPLYFRLIFSGLTEYLFALNLIICIYLLTKKNFPLASIFCSFLPFVRSEGLIVVAIFALFLIIETKNKLYVLLLLTGHLIYSFIGYFYYKDIFWVFTKIPYNSLSSPYGHGNLFDFVHRLNYVIEKPIYLILMIGIISIAWTYSTSGSKNIDKIMLLILTVFLAFFISHSIFWYLGIFNSMGLPRVLISVLPLIALISIFGLNFIAETIKHSLVKKIILVSVSLVIIIYPFTKRSEGVVYDQNLFIIKENDLIDKEVAFTVKNYMREMNKPVLYYSHPYISVALDVDHFEYKTHQDINKFNDRTTGESIIIWDDWFAVVEGGVSLDYLKNNPGLQILKECSSVEGKRVIKFVIFKTI